MNDLFILYKETDLTNKDVERLASVLREKVYRKKLGYESKESETKVDDTDNDIIIKQYSELVDDDDNKFESARSSILVALIDDEVFYDSRCRDIWRSFWNRQSETEHQIIYPAFIKTVEPLNFDPDKRKMYDDCKTLGHYDFTNLKNAVDFDKLSEHIGYTLSKMKKDTPLPKDIGKRNMNPITIKIPSALYLSELEFENSLSKAFKEIETEYNRNKETREHSKNADPVCVIYTGGTAGMIHSKETSDLRPADIKELVSHLPRLRGKDSFADMDFYSFGDLYDSSNMNSSHWIIIARVIEKLYDKYQGFVIIHGVNTLAYTAAALSFMFENLDKPIILTGAELALTERHSDAEQNIQKAIEIAARGKKPGESVSDVCILFGRRLIKGNRATKQIALDTTEGFYSPNSHDLAIVAHDRYVIDPTVVRSLSNIKDSKEPFACNQYMSNAESVAIVDVYPDMNMSLLKGICDNNNIEVVILRTYGTGGVPDDNEQFKEFLKTMQERYKIIVILTQCPRGTVELRISETNANLFKHGVISGGDMITEAAFCKIKHLLKKFQDVKNDDKKSKDKRLAAIKHYMMISMRGELSTNMFIVDVSSLVDLFNNGELNIKPEKNEQLYLDRHWSDNPALKLEHRTGKKEDTDKLNERFEKDKYASFPVEPLIINAILQFSAVEFNRVNEDENKKLKIEVYLSKDKENKHLSPFIWEHESILGKPWKGDINIDITSQAKEVLRHREPFYITVRAINCEATFKTTTIWISVRDRI